jgi:ankyrin repeat protein
VVKLLLERGANPNVTDTFYNATPMSWAQMGKHYDVVTALLQAGAANVDTLLLDAVSDKDKALVEAALKSGRAKPETVSVAWALAAAAID